MPPALYWDAGYEIVLELENHYPHMDLNALGLEELYHYIVALPTFADDPLLANDGLLRDILREWFEERET
ncbi:MAG TPA: Fe-S cluster assembly protein IscX [Aggregatilineales bacterium]|nr:Fe-S cluster assembly protein IscX [Anaerolineae bacterium]HUN07017.1 Fe-S cluster assembly protein IscX [Aggregatilineales bacterium]